MFFSFDGIDGVGKSTQLKLFVQWLEESGHNVTVCRDPGGTGLGDEVRRLLLSHDSARIDMHCEMLLYMASRAQLVSEIIAPALQAGGTVVCDRYVLATIAYQGHAGELPVDDIRAVGAVATQGIYPDLTFLLDNNPASVAGRFETLDRVEARGVEFQQKVRAGFLAEAALQPDRIRVIDASRSIETIQAEICELVDEALASKKQSGATQ